MVLESVDRAARDADSLAGADVVRPTVNRPSRGAFEPVDRLLEGVVAVRHRHLAVGRYEALEDARTAIRVGGLDPEAHPEGAHLNHLCRCGSHRSWSLTA